MLHKIWAFVVWLFEDYLRAAIFGGAALLFAALADYITAVYFQLGLWQKIALFLGVFLIAFSLIAIIYRQLKRTIKNTKPLSQNNNDQYLDRLIIDSKFPLVNEISTTLQKMADYQNVVLNRLLTRKIKMRKLAKIQETFRKKIGTKTYDNALGNSVKIEILKKEMKRLGLYSDNFSEKDVQLLVEITWVLDEFGVGIPQELDNKEYGEYETQLNNQSAKVNGDKTTELILTYKDLMLGWNSLIVYIHYFPKNLEPVKSMPVEISKTTAQLKHERDQILRTMLHEVSREIEKELRTR
jgi:hypothetical protein